MCLFAHKNDILNVIRRFRINMEKHLLVSSDLSVCLSVSLSVYLHARIILAPTGWICIKFCTGWLVIRKSVEHLHILLKSNKNIWHFTWRPKTHILKSISNKLHNFSKIWHSYLFHPLSVAIFREYQYLKSYRNLWYRLLIINGNIPI